MTMQISEILTIDNETHYIEANPLREALRWKKKKVEFMFQTTACWRGYQGKWLIENDRLFFIGIDAKLNNGEPVTIKTIFPRAESEKIFAEWYWGVLKIDMGKLLKSEAYRTRYEQYLLIEIDNGKVVNRIVIDDSELDKHYYDNGLYDEEDDEYDDIEYDWTDPKGIEDNYEDTTLEVEDEENGRKLYRKSHPAEWDDYDTPDESSFFDGTDGQLGEMGDEGWEYLGRD